MQAKQVRQTVAAVLADAEPLWLRPGAEIIEDGRPLLPELVTVDALIDALKQTRLALLRYERALGTSWNEIEQATGTHASTWRFRHRKGVPGA